LCCCILRSCVVITGKTQGGAESKDSTHRVYRLGILHFHRYSTRYFAEVNAEAKRLVVEKCARHAAALEENSDITPEEARSAKGSAYNLLLSQFRRAIGCLGMKVAVEEKLRRIMLIRSNKREANAAAHNGASNHRKCFNKNSPRWYSNERNEANYDSFYRYRTKYDNFHSYENRNNADL
jgi:hypothetical protein